MVVTQEYTVDLTATAGDKALTMICPADGATVREWYVKVDTAGVGAAANHELVLEHGLAGAGVALTPVLELDADAAAETIVSGTGLQPPSITTVGGTTLQILNAESASITTGAIVDITVTWLL
jgi:hypothetical protein